MADSLGPANMRYLQVGQRVGGARYMCAVETFFVDDDDCFYYCKK